MTYFCTVPSVRGFVLPDGSFRDCCATTPYVRESNKDFKTWWLEDSRLNDLRGQLRGTTFPPQCRACELQEQGGKDSFRLAVNRAHAIVDARHPAEWSIHFGNVCNLACWTCSEDFSSTIESHKRQEGLLQQGWVGPNMAFAERWPSLLENILLSYDHHHIVTLSILGGEPTYNPIVAQFLLGLIGQGLGARTKLEITTNGTKTNPRLAGILDSKHWHYISIFVSIDALGSKAEWLRYGSDWKDVDANTRLYASTAHHVEIHTTLSMLNLDDLCSLHDYAQELGVTHTIIPLTMPSYLSITAYDGSWSCSDPDAYRSRGLDRYLDMVSSQPKPGSVQRMRDHIAQFPNRKPFDLGAVLR